MNLIRFAKVLARLKLLNFSRKIYLKYLKLKKLKARYKMRREIKKCGRYAIINLGKCLFILDRNERHDYEMLKMLELNENSYEFETTMFIKNSLQLGDSFMDIGANNGYYTIWASQIVGENGKVFSIEPNPHAYERLIRNINLNNLKNVYPYKLALSDRNGSAELLLNSNDEDGSASLKSIMEQKPIAKVDVKKFDDLFLNEEINLIKMDVEGSEIEIIKGMENYLSTHKNLKIVIEWNPSYMSKQSFDYLIKLFRIRLIKYYNGRIQTEEIFSYEKLLVLTNLLLELR